MLYMMAVIVCCTSLALVLGTWFYEHPYCTDSDTLSFLTFYILSISSPTDMVCLCFKY